MEKLSNKELLKFAVQNGMIDFNTIQMQVEMNERLKFLEMHESKIWQSTDGKWYTYLPDLKNKSGRRLVKRSTEKGIVDIVVEHYKDCLNEPTIETVFYEWIEKKLKYKEISQQTVDRYKTDFERFFSAEKNRKIRYIDEEFLEDFVIDNITEHDLKAKAWANLRTIMRGMFLYAKKKGYCSISITTFLDELDLSKKMFNHEKKPEENVIYTETEVKKLISEIGNSKNINDIAILFAIYTGMRVGEIVALKWEDILDDFIYVNRTQIRYKDENGKVVHEIRDFPKTEAGIRHIVIVPELQKVIKRLKAINPFEEYAFYRNGRCVPKHSVCTRLYELCDKFGFPRKGMHALRRYYATKLINAGVEEIIIISQMGHTDFKTTKDYYYKNNTEKEYVCEKVSKAICG